MASKKPKTAWGKAYSERFKQLKREWDRTRKVGGSTIRTWKSAFTALGRLARKHADSKATNPVVGRKKAGSRKVSRRKSKTGGRKSKRKRSVVKRVAKRVARKFARRTPRKAPKKTRTTARRPGRLFQLLKRTPKPAARAAAPSRVELVEIHTALGKLVNRTQSTSTLRKDGTREVVGSGTWTPEANTVRKARKLREQLTGKGVRFHRITVLVDGKRQDRKRKGRVRHSEGKLYLE